MGRTRRHATALAVLVLTLLAQVAWAAPTEVQRDRTDNTFYFSYNADDGSIPYKTSAARFRKGDPVHFFAYVDSRPQTEIGRRLVGRLVLELTPDADGARAYRGTFTMTVVDDSTGEVAFAGQKVKDVVLRPRRGDRRATVYLRFDVPSGSYSVTGAFRAGS